MFIYPRNTWCGHAVARFIEKTVTRCSLVPLASRGWSSLSQTENKTGLYSVTDCWAISAQHEATLKDAMVATSIPYICGTSVWGRLWARQPHTLVTPLWHESGNDDNTNRGYCGHFSHPETSHICGCVDPRLCAEGNFMMCWTLCCGHAISFYYHGRHYYYFLPADVDKWGPRCTSTKNLWACSICQFARCYQPRRGKQPVERNVSDGHPSPTAAL